MVSIPQYVLFCDSTFSKGPVLESSTVEKNIGFGRWHFVMERLDEPERFEAFDTESEIHRDRLALLAVIRGLESLELSGRVRLVTTSRYVDRGLRFGLPAWRDNQYHWESFGRFTPVRNADLWRRINIAMQFHDITCRRIPQTRISTNPAAHDPRTVQTPTFRPRNRSHAAAGSQRRLQWWEMAAAWIQSGAASKHGQIPALGT